MQNQGPVDDGGGYDLEEIAAVRRAKGSMRVLALTGGRWRALESVAVQGLQIFSTMALARLLTPDDFGIVAVVTLAILLFGLLTQVGFGASVVRRDSVDQGYLSSMFWASSLLGLVAAIVAVLLAPLFATLAGNPAATPYLAVASVILLFGMIKSVPRALLLREFRFRDTAAMAIAGFIIYMVIAIVLAATTDLGAWAIVIGRVISHGFDMGGQWVMSRFLPSFHIRRAEVREDLGFNLTFLGMRGSSYLAKNIDYFYVGSALGPAALGTYYIAYVLPNLIRRRMTTVVSGPLFVTVSRFASDLDRVRRAYLGSVGIITLVAYPVLIGLALVADELIRLAFGSQWLDAIEPMAILAVAAAINAIGPAGSAIFTAIGKPGRNIVVYLSWTAMIVAGLTFVVNDGLTAVALVVLIATFASLMLQVALLRGPIDLPWGSVFRAVWPATATTAVMAAAVLGTRMLIAGASNSFLRLLILVAVGAITYFAFGFLAFRKVFSGATDDVRTMVRGRGVRKTVATDGADDEA